IVVSGEAVYVGGNFTSAGGITVSNIARWNRRAGIWEALQDGSIRGVDGGVTTMLEADGDLAVFGGFTLAGTVPSARAAVWHPDSNRWTALGGGIPSAPTAALRLENGFIAACPDSSNRWWRLYRWENGDWEICCRTIEGSVQALAEPDDGAGIVIGGSFTAVEGVPLRTIARWNGSSWGHLDEPPSGARSAVVYAVASAGSSLYAGGAFSTAGGRPARSIARWDPNRALWEPLGPDTADGVLGEVHCLLGDEDNLFVGGFFFQAGQSNAAHIARWEQATKTWHPLFPEASLQPDGAVRALVSDGDVLYVGGDFKRIDTFSVLGLAAWDKRTGIWSRIDEGLEVKYGDIVVEAMAFADGNLYIAGYFEPHEGMGGTAVLRRERNAWYIVAENVSGTVGALWASGEDLYIGGAFDSLGGIASRNIARWNRRRLMFSPLGSGMDGAVTALATGGVQVFAGGEFSEAGGEHAAGIARWDGTQWHALGSGIDGPVHSIWRRGSDLYLGGSFLQAGGCRAVRAAHWDDIALPVEAPVHPGAEIELAAVPMPVNGSGVLTVRARRPVSVRIGLFDMKGSRASDVFTGSVAEGTTLIPFDASHLPSGMYTIVLFHENGFSLLPVIVLGR
ncbi:MAG: hypothetical protein QHI48_10140, partial [Bacteroidota bacterium]|nr:hypothetical protein [Bacteroidota bacterium]